MNIFQTTSSIKTTRYYTRIYVLGKTHHKKQYFIRRPIRTFLAIHDQSSIMSCIQLGGDVWSDNGRKQKLKTISQSNSDTYLIFMPYYGAYSTIFYIFKQNCEFVQNILFCLFLKKSSLHVVLNPIWNMVLYGAFASVEQMFSFYNDFKYDVSQMYMYVG